MSTENFHYIEAGTYKSKACLMCMTVAMLRTIFEGCEKLQLYVSAPDISSLVPRDLRTAKTVYIKAARAVSSGKVADLIEVIKEAGADPIGLVADRQFRAH